MTRTRRGYIARRRRTKMRSVVAGWGKSSPQHQIKALDSAHRDRDRQKRNFRCLWITRINAVFRRTCAFHCYNDFMHTLYKRGAVLNRKIIAQIAILHPNCLDLISRRCLYLLVTKNNTIYNEIIKEVDCTNYSNLNRVPRRVNPGKLK